MEEFSINLSKFGIVNIMGWFSATNSYCLMVRSLFRFFPFFSESWLVFVVYLSFKMYYMQNYISVLYISLLSTVSWHSEETIKKLLFFFFLMLSHLLLVVLKFHYIVTSCRYIFIIFFFFHQFLVIVNYYLLEYRL